MNQSATPTQQSLESYFRAMLSGVLSGASWTREADIDARLDKLALSASALAQAASLAYPEADLIAWRVAGEIIVQEAGADSVITAAFGNGKKLIVNGLVQLATPAKKELIPRMAKGCASDGQRLALIEGATTIRRSQPSAPPDLSDPWIQLANAACERFEGIQKRLRPEAISTRVEQCKLAFGSAQQACSESSELGEREPDAFFAQQALLATRAKAEANGSDEQREQALQTALSIAQRSALSQHPLAQDSFEIALAALDALMPRKYGSNATQNLINKSAMFWIGALEGSPRLEPMAARCLRVLLRESAPLLKEDPLRRDARLSAFEELRLSWARAALGDHPEPADFKRFSSEGGWSPQPYQQERLMAFSGLEHAACSALSAILSAIQGGSLNTDVILRSIAWIDRARELGLTQPETRRFEPEALIDACKEGLSRARERLWAIGRGDLWSDLNERLNAGCGPEWGFAETINLAQASKTGLPVDRVATALTSGALGHSPALLAELSGALTQSRDRLVAALEAQELRDSMGASPSPTPRSKASL